MEFGPEKKGKGYSREEVQAYLERTERETRKTLDEQVDRIRALRDENERLSARVKELEARESAVSEALIAASLQAAEIERNARAKADATVRAARSKYLRELEDLKSFHAKWTEYFAQILARYPLDETLERADRFNGAVAELLAKLAVPDPREAEAARIVKKTAARRKPAGPTLQAPTQARAQHDEETRRLGGAAGINMSAVGEALADAVSEDARYEEIARKWTADAAPAPVTDYLDERAAHIVDPRTGVDASMLATPSESGFSFEEALHPTDSLDDIMKSFGLGSDPDKHD